MQEEITVDMEEWVPDAAAVDLERLFRCQGCSGAERTYKYFMLSVEFKDEEAYTRDLC